MPEAAPANGAPVLKGAAPAIVPRSGTGDGEVSLVMMLDLETEVVGGRVDRDAGEERRRRVDRAAVPILAGVQARDELDEAEADGKKGEQALSIRILDPLPSVSANAAAAARKDPEDMGVIVLQGYGATETAAGCCTTMTWGLTLGRQRITSSRIAPHDAANSPPTPIANSAGSYISSLTL